MTTLARFLAPLAWVAIFFVLVLGCWWTLQWHYTRDAWPTWTEAKATAVACYAETRKDVRGRTDARGRMP